MARWLRYWLAQAEPHLRPSTLHGYRDHIDRYLIPSIGRITLADLTGKRLQACFSLLARQRTKKGTLIAASTVDRVRATLRSALNAAVREGLIAGNPLAQVRLDKPVRPHPVIWTDERVEAWRRDGIRPPVAVWTLLQLITFLTGVENDRLAALWWLIALRGLRRGEATLDRDDLDSEARELTITRQLIALPGEHGISSVAPALPSCGEASRPAGPHGPGLPEDVAAVRSALTEGNEPAVVVAHSYGGIVTAEAAAGAETVGHLVFVSSYLPEPGESLATFGADAPPPFLDFDPDGGTFGARPELFAEMFAQDCPPDIARDGAARLVRQTLAVTRQPVRAAAWHDLPTTYLVCTEDRGTPPAAQRKFARRAGNIIEVKTGHHPFLWQPQAVADIIASLSWPGQWTWCAALELLPADGAWSRPGPVML